MQCARAMDVNPLELVRRNPKHLMGTNRRIAIGWGSEKCVVELLVAAGAAVEPEWLLSEKVRADPAMRAALQGGTT